MISNLVIHALYYEAARLYHEQHPEEFGALAQEEYAYEMLEKEILIQAERIKADG